MINLLLEYLYCQNVLKDDKNKVKRLRDVYLVRCNTSLLWSTEEIRLLLSPLTRIIAPIVKLNCTVECTTFSL